MSRQASGLQAWAMQRLTALYLAAYLVWLLAWLLLQPPASHEAWKQWLGSPWVSLASLLALLCLLFHAWIGLRDVIIDYVHPALVKVLLLGLVMLYLGACGIWAGKVLLLAGVAL